MQYSTHIDNQVTRHNNAKLLGKPVGPVSLADVSGFNWKADNGQHSVHIDQLQFRTAQQFFGGDYTPAQSNYGLFARKVL